VPQSLHLAVDVGGTKILAAAATGGGDGRWLRIVRRLTPREAPVETLVAILDELAAGARPRGIALSLPGPLDRRSGRPFGAPNLSAAWHRAALVDELGSRYGCPVVVENDCNCAALAEAVRGAGAGHRTVVYYTVSTGVGTGVVHDGRLLTGRDDTEGGHHVVWPAPLGGPRCACGSTGCLEAVVSGAAVERRYGVPPERLDDEAWRDIGQWLGLAVVNAAMFHDPDVVVFGGGMTDAWERWWPAMIATVDETLTLREPPLVRRALLGEDRNLHGALSRLLERAPTSRPGDVPHALTLNPSLEGADIT
jgi:glucokinase